MLYNIEQKTIKTDLTCLECPHFDKDLKKCVGIGKVCFEFDQVTNTCIDSVTGLPFNPNDKQ